MKRHEKNKKSVHSAANRGLSRTALGCLQTYGHACFCLVFIGGRCVLMLERARLQAGSCHAVLSLEFTLAMLLLQGFVVRQWWVGR